MNKLPRNLRALFGFLRALSLLWLVVLPIVMLNPKILPGFAVAPGGTVGVGEFKLSTAQSPMVISGGDGRNRVEVHFLQVTGALDLETVSASFRAWVLGSMIFVHALSAGWFFWLFGRLRNVCHNLERGLVFSPENTNAISQIGWGLILYTCFVFVLQIVFKDTVIDPLYAEGVVQGVLGEHFRLDRYGGSLTVGVHAGGPVRNLVVGALVLLLARAFEQGLKLKTENDLTV